MPVILSDNEWRLMTDEQKADYCLKIADQYPDEHPQKAEIMEVVKELRGKE